MFSIRWIRTEAVLKHLFLLNTKKIKSWIRTEAVLKLQKRSGHLGKPVCWIRTEAVLKLADTYPCETPSSLNKNRSCIETFLFQYSWGDILLNKNRSCIETQFLLILGGGKLGWIRTEAVLKLFQSLIAKSNKLLNKNRSCIETPDHYAIVKRKEVE